MSDHTLQDTAFASSRNLSKGMIARQPIVNDLQQIIGYELFNRSRSPYGHTMASDATLVFAALTHAGEEDLVGTKLMFVNCTHEGLTGEHLELLPADKVVLEIPPLGHAAVREVAARLPTLQALKAQGFHLAFNHTVLESVYAAWLPLADYIKIDLSVLAPGQLTVLVNFANRHTHAELIAEKVESAQQHELAQRLGISLFQGFWFARPTVMQTRLLTPTQQSIIQLLALVRQQASTEEIEELLKKDPTLSFNLLRFINSSGFGLSCEITSFRHAVMILGLKKLFRWAALLLTTSRVGGMPPAVGQTAVVRGRLMELLSAELLPPEESDHAFVVGVFSLLDVMLNQPMAKALESVALPQSIVDALVHNQGVFAPFLELTRACESGDDAAFARAANALQLSNHQVNWAHLQALSWADSLATEDL